MLTTYDRGILQGQLQERRETALMLREAKFGPLSPEVNQRVEAMTAEQLRQLLLDQAKADSLKALGLQD